MTTIQKTPQDILAFLQTAAGWIQRHKDQPETKFKYALERVMRTASKVWTNYQEALAVLDVEYAAEDEKGFLVKEPAANGAPGEFRYKKEDLLKRDEARRQLFTSPAPVDVYMAKEAPENLSTAERYAFADFVIPPPTEPTE